MWVVLFWWWRIWRWRKSIYGIYWCNGENVCDCFRLVICDVWRFRLSDVKYLVYDMFFDVVFLCYCFLFRVECGFRNLLCGSRKIDCDIIRKCFGMVNLVDWIFVLLCGIVSLLIKSGRFFIVIGWESIYKVNCEEWVFN